MSRFNWLVLICFASAHASGAADGGIALYEQHCATCHTATDDPLIPSRFGLSRMNPLVLLTTLRSGKMQIQAAGLSEAEQQQLVEALTGSTIEEFEIPQSAFCPTRLAPVNPDSVQHWAGWGGDAAASGHVSAKSAALSKAEVPTLQLKWVLAFPGSRQARSQPAVIGEALYVGSASGGVYAVNARTGCIYWRVDTASAVRGAIEFGSVGDGVATLYFAASNTVVYAVNAVTGEIIWQRRAGFEPLSGVTGSVVFHNGRLYVPITSREVGAAGNPDHECCTSSGGVVALNAANGAQIWQMRTTGAVAEEVARNSAGKRTFAPSGAPVWASPTLDAKRNRLYIGTGENYSRPATHTSDAIMALDLDTGAVVWSQQFVEDDAWHIGCRRMPDRSPCDDPGPDLDFGMAPIMANLANGKQVLLAGQKSAVVYAFDPDANGRVLWQTRVGKGSALGGIHWGMATDDARVYVTNADRPSIIKDVNPEVDLAPGTYALDVATGRMLWDHPTPGERCSVLQPADAGAAGNRRRRCLASNSAAPSVLEGVVFAGDLAGYLRAYATDDGRLLWEYDTNREFTAVNGIPAKGGSIDGPGPVIGNGMLYVNSGYGSFGQLPGNVLLAFAPAKDRK